MRNQVLGGPKASTEWRGGPQPEARPPPLAVLLAALEPGSLGPGRSTGSGGSAHMFPPPHSSAGPSGEAAPVPVWPLKQRLHIDPQGAH